MIANYHKKKYLERLMLLAEIFTACYNTFFILLEKYKLHSHYIVC